MNLTLSLQDLSSLSHFLILLTGGLVLILIESFSTSSARKLSTPITLSTFAIAFAASIYPSTSNHPLLTPWVSFDPISHFFNLFFLAVGFATTLLADTFFKQEKSSCGEFYFLVISAIFGMLLIADAADFLTLFLGLETLSIALYVLCGYLKKRERASEASMKYFFLGSLAASLLVYGVALIYGAVGTTKFSALLTAYKTIGAPTSEILFLLGIGLITTSLAFKAAIVPFHTWAPDVYEGASNPITALMIVGTKAAAFVAFVRIFFDALPQFHPYWTELISWLAIGTLIFANFVAIRQSHVRRFFAYSGISHAGFLAIAIVVGGNIGLLSLKYYLLVYACAAFGAFAILSYSDTHNGGLHITDLRGFSQRAPWLAVMLALFLFTLAGIPPTAGFFAKFWMLKIAFAAGYPLLVFVALLTSVLSAYYYIRIIGLLFTDNPEIFEQRKLYSPSSLFLATAGMAGIVLLTLFPGG